METCLQSEKAGKSQRKQSLMSFYGNLIQYYKVSPMERDDVQRMFWNFLDGQPVSDF